MIGIVVCIMFAPLDSEIVFKVGMIVNMSAVCIYVILESGLAFCTNIEYVKNPQNSRASTWLNLLRFFMYILGEAICYIVWFTLGIPKTATFFKKYYIRNYGLHRIYSLSFHLFSCERKDTYVYYWLEFYLLIYSIFFFL